MNLTNVVNIVRGILKLRGGSDNTIIGNTGDALKTIDARADSNNPGFDSYNRTRTSEPNFIYNYEFSKSKLDLLFTESITGTASSTFVPASAACRLSVGTVSGNGIIRQTKLYNPYEAGMSYFMTMSANIGAKKTNVRQRLGYYDNNDGIFFEQTGTTLGIVRRTSTSGAPVDTSTLQASWNLDKLDGTGTSGQTLDTSKHNTYVIDFIWQGAGKVRFGVVLNGVIVYCHQLTLGNSLTVPYLRTPSLPIRFEISNTGTSASTTTMNISSVCLAKENSGPLTPSLVFSASRLAVKITSNATLKPLISVRPKTTFNGITNRVVIKPFRYSVYANQQAIYYRIYLNPTLTGAAFTSAATSSAAEYDVTATAITGGTLIAEGYCPAANGVNLTEADFLFLGLDLAGTVQDTITIATVSIAGGNSDTYGIIGWREFQ